jgi:hypothetical protein
MRCCKVAASLMSGRNRGWRLCSFLGMADDLPLTGAAVKKSRKIVYGKHVAVHHLPKIVQQVLLYGNVSCRQPVKAIFYILRNIIIVNHRGERLTDSIYNELRIGIPA